MKNFTLLFIFLISPFVSLLKAQCFDLSVEDVVACEGDQIVLALTISGGEAPYLVTWMDNTTSGSEIIATQDGSFTLLINQSANLTFTVTDNTNCTETTSSTVTFAPFLEADIILTNPVSCNNECNGEASIIAAGGTGGFTYSWSNGLIGNQATDLCPGNYQVTITDVVGCQAIINFSILSNVMIIDIPPELVTPASCVDANDGAVEVLVSGGQFPYTYFWMGPNGFTATNINITGLSPGLYILQVTDANGCSETFSIEVPGADPIDIAYSTSGIACSDEGFITIDNVMGGTEPYSFSLNGGPFTFTSTFENLISGTYLISVSDANGCLTVETITIESQIDMDIVAMMSNCDSLGGSALATVDGGTTSPTFIWSNGTVGPEISNVAPGGYSVTVTDNLTNCVTHQNVEVLYDPSCFVQISGRVILDPENEDCLEDPTTSPAPYILVALSDEALTFTDTNGYYEFETAPGIYELTINPNNTFVDPLCTDPITVSVPDFGDTSPENNFWVTYPDNQDLAVSVSAGPVRPGFDQSVVVIARNLGGTPMDGTLTFSHDLLQTYLSSTPAADDYDLASTTLSWDFENLNPGESRSYVARLNLPASVELGTPILYTATIGPVENDLNAANNTKEVQLLVTGSYDPNDKQVSPRGAGAAGEISRADSILTYQVRFQNTGTDTAFTVVILDKISENLDITTVRPGAASHPYQLNVLDRNTLEFRFENILLPDSFINEPASNGYVLFEINTKKDLPFGSTFENTAGIYFDFNQPIITNTVLNTLTAPTAVADLTPRPISTRISPNPGGAESILFYSLEAAAVLNVGIYDLNGKLLEALLYEERKDAGTYQLGLEGLELPQGVYFIRLETEDGLGVVEKWVRMED